MRSTFSVGRLADMAVIVIALAVMVQLVLQLVDRTRRSGASDAAEGFRRARSGAAGLPRPLEPGDRVPADGRIDLSRADQTLMMFLRSGCRYCTASVPLYRRFQELRRVSGASVAFVAISNEPQAVLDDYLGQHNVVVDETLSLPASEIERYGIRGTPTLVLATRDGVVRKTWIGQLQEPAEQELLEFLSEPAQSR